MNNKDILEYVVPPLEGLWSVDDEFRGGGASIKDKSKFIWKMMIRQPSFVSEEVFKKAVDILSRKKTNLDLSKAKLEAIKEGLVVQIMHIGSYDDEPRTVLMIDDYATKNGYEIDINDKRFHHEIYISDPRRVEASKLKTIIRHPIKLTNN